MPLPILIVAAGVAGVGYAIYRGVVHDDWSGVNVGDAEPGYRWDDSDGHSGIEAGIPPTDGGHPRKPGNWNTVD